MKKIITILVFVFSIVSIHAQYVKEEPGNFNTVQISDKIKVVLVPSDKTMVEVSGTHSEKVQISNKGGKLSLSLPNSETLQGEMTQANVYFKSLENIQADNGAIIICTSPIESYAMNLSVKNRSDVYVYLKTINVTVDLANNSVLKLIGNSDNQTINSKDNCELKARDFIAKKTTITLQADGNAQVFASDSVNAKVVSSGFIFVYGAPPAVTQNADGSGTITIVQ